MASSEILLIQPVDNLGAEGDQVTVKAGFARNFLLPKGLAVPVTKANRKQIEALKVRRAQREAQNLADAKAQGERLSATSLAFAVKTGDSGKMFGAITAANIHEKIVEAGFDIDRKKIQLENPVKELGQHSVIIKIHPEVEAEVKFDIVSENPIVEDEADADADDE